MAFLDTIMIRQWQQQSPEQSVQPKLRARYLRAMRKYSLGRSGRRGRSVASRHASVCALQQSGGSMWGTRSGNPSFAIFTDEHCIGVLPIRIYCSMGCGSKTSATATY